MHRRDWVSWVITEVLNFNIGFVFLSLFSLLIHDLETPLLHIVLAVFGILNQSTAFRVSIHLHIWTSLKPSLSFQFLWLHTSVNCKQTDHFPDGDKAVIDFTSLPNALQICFLQNSSAEQIQLLNLVTGTQ